MENAIKRPTSRPTHAYEKFIYDAPTVHTVKISNAINTVSEKNNYSHVFSAGVPGVDVLLYARPSDDISLLVFEELGIDPPPTQE